MTPTLKNSRLSLLVLVAFLEMQATHSFSLQIPWLSQCQQGTSSAAQRHTSCLYNSVDDYLDADEDEEDDDEYIDTDSLGDWRNFRRSLSMLEDSSAVAAEEESSTKSLKASTKTVSKENEDLLKSQNEELHEEYKSGVWAHETSTVSRSLLPKYN